MFNMFSAIILDNSRFLVSVFIFSILYKLILNNNKLTSIESFER